MAELPSNAFESFSSNSPDQRYQNGISADNHSANAGTSVWNRFGRKWQRRSINRHSRSINNHSAQPIQCLEDRLLLAAVADVDGDDDFDANDAFLMHLVALSATDDTIQRSKGGSSLTATEIRTAIKQARVAADVDRDADFDANDSFLIQLVSLAGTDVQIDQTKGSSTQEAAQIRINVNNLGPTTSVVFSELDEGKQLLNGASGATIITHGLQVFADGGDSLLSLAQSVLTRTGGWLVDYDIAAEGEVGTFEVTRRPGLGNEVVLLFDWAEESNEPSAGWGEAAGDALFSIIAGLGLVDPAAGANNTTPLHFIGHSFGTAITSEAIERLAYFDVPVDQVTYLDPHDFDQSGLPIDGNQELDQLGLPALGQGYGVSVWNNVEFADVYYQTAELPDGRPIAGAFNTHLTAADLGAGALHSLVWSRYYLDSVLDNSSNDRFGLSRLGGQSGNRPTNRFFNTDGTQDHEHTDPLLANPLTGLANTTGLQTLGLSQNEITNVKWAPEWAPSLVNGSFQNPGDDNDGIPGTGDSSVPGWTHHGGGGDGHVDPVGDGFVLELDLFNEGRTHNWTYFAPEFQQLEFDYEVTDSSSNDTLQIRIGTNIIDTLPLNSATSGSKQYDVAEFRGTVQTITFEIIEGGLLIDAEVQISNVLLSL